MFSVSLKCEDLRLLFDIAKNKGVDPEQLARLALRIGLSAFSKNICESTARARIFEEADREQVERMLNEEGYTLTDYVRTMGGITYSQAHKKAIELGFKISPKYRTKEWRAVRKKRK